MTSTEREQTINRYRDAHAELVAALGRFPREMWQFRAGPQEWTIHEIVIHITDSEANSFVRGRRAIAEPGTAVSAYDERRWAEALRYHEQSTEVALELFRWLREASYLVIRDLPEGVWGQTIEHPENGTMTLDDWLGVYARHISDHVAQMEGVYAAWEAAGRPGA